MNTPQSEVDDLLDRARAQEQDPDAGLIDTLIFGVAHRIVEYEDPGLLKVLPKWIERGVYKMRDSYLKTNHYRIFSNNDQGIMDHSEMMRKLTKLLDDSGSPQGR
jgi:hypothetical protein